MPKPHVKGQDQPDFNPELVSQFTGAYSAARDSLYFLLDEAQQERSAAQAEYEEAIAGNDPVAFAVKSDAYAIASLAVSDLKGQLAALEEALGIVVKRARTQVAL